MKTIKVELDMDFIGGQGSLTKEEEKAISQFLKLRKLTAKQKVSQKTKVNTPHNIVAI